MIDSSEKIRFVKLVPYNSSWEQLFLKEKNLLQSILQDNCIEIHHIGSTAVPNIYAKPIIDMLPIVRDLKLVDELNQQFEAIGYTCMGEYGIAGRRFYWKSKENRTHQIHLFEQGSTEIARHINFKDFMLAHVEFANSYSIIKRGLAKVFPTDIENYVNGKASFVQCIDYKTSSARSAQLTAADKIVIQSYNPAWPKLAEAEINSIKQISTLPYLSIDHLGSTAVPTLASKPIIDIFITLESLSDAKPWINLLDTLGYVFWDENPDPTHMRFFKGMPPFGLQRTHHVHILANQDDVKRRILFRNILRSNESLRLEYAALKLRLAQDDSIDREVYTDSKGEFIKKVLSVHGKC